MSDTRSEAEKRWHAHMARWGSDGYGVCMQKTKSGWIWVEAFGVEGAPTVYKRKRDLVAALEAYEAILCDKAAGRCE